MAFVSIFLSPAYGDVIRCDGGATAMAIAAIVAAVVSAGVAVKNSISAKKSKAAADRTIGGLKAENASEYYADYYRGALENDSTKAYLKRLEKAMDKQNKTLDNSIVASGATTENKLAARQAKNEVMSGAMGQAVAAEDQYKRQVKNAYFNNNRSLALAQMQSDQQYEAQKEANLSDLAGSLQQAVSAYGMVAGEGGFGSGMNRSRKAWSTYTGHQRSTIASSGLGKTKGILAGSRPASYGPKVGLK